MKKPFMRKPNNESSGKCSWLLMLGACVAMLATACRSDKRDSDLDQVPTEKEVTLADYLSTPPNYLSEDEQRALDGEINAVMTRMANSVVRIGKVQVRLWNRAPDHPEKSDFPAFITPEEVTYQQEEMLEALAAIDDPSSTKSDLVFEGCQTTGFLETFGKPAISPGVSAVKECGYLVLTPEKDQLRQFEFIVDSDGYQRILVTTNIFQRAAVFRARRPPGELAIVIARENSWSRDPAAVRPIVVHSKFDSNTALGVTEARLVQRALDLNATPTTLSDASKRWYDNQVHVESRKPVAGGTISAALGAWGIAQMVAGANALLAVSGGKAVVAAVGAGEVLANATATAQLSTSWVMAAGGLWKILAGGAVAGRALTDIMQLDRQIDLIPDPRVRARSQFALMLFHTGTAVVGLADVVVSSRLFFTLVSKQFISLTTHAAVPRDLLAGTVNPIATSGSQVTNATKELARDVMGIKFDIRHPIQFTNQVIKRFAQHGQETRDAFIKLGDAHRVAVDVMFYKKQQVKLVSDAVALAEKSLVFSDLTTKGMSAYRVVTVFTDELIQRMAWDYIDKTFVDPNVKPKK